MPKQPTLDKLAKFHQYKVDYRHYPISFGLKKARAKFPSHQQTNLVSAHHTTNMITSINNT
jgi:hypothetical protein